MHQECRRCGAVHRIAGAVIRLDPWRRDMPDCPGYSTYPVTCLVCGFTWDWLGYTPPAGRIVHLCPCGGLLAPCYYPYAAAWGRAAAQCDRCGEFYVEASPQQRLLDGQAEAQRVRRVPAT